METTVALISTRVVTNCWASILTHEGAKRTFFSVYGGWRNMHELQCLLRQQLLTNRRIATETLAAHAWLLIPDVRVPLLTGGQQGVYREVDLGPDLQVDFLVYEIYDGQVFWQLSHIASPTAAILDDSQPSAEFQRGLHEVRRWQDWIARNGFATPSGSLFSTLPPFISYRLVIGQSEQQTADERSEVRRQRRADLRIRSFCWLLEKPTHYSPAEISILEQFGQAKSAEEFKRHGGAGL